MILHCTQRAARELSVSKSQIEAAIPDQPAPSEDWYAHVFFMGRIKCLIVTHGQSLFSSVLEGYKRTDSKDIEKLVKTMVSKTLFLENLPAEAVQKGAALINSIQYARTTDKRILGSMNDMIKLYKYMRDEGCGTCRDYTTAMQDINRTPMSILKGVYPIEAFVRMLGYSDYKTNFRGAAA